RRERDHAVAQDDVLRRQAFEVHLDAMLRAVVERLVAEAVEIEIGAELAVDAAQQVEIEGGGDAGRIVIGGLEHPLVLDEIDADDEVRALPKQAGGLAPGTGRLRRLEIADGRAPGEYHPRPRAGRGGQAARPWGS